MAISTKGMEQTISSMRFKELFRSYVTIPRFRRHILHGAALLRRESADGKNVAEMRTCQVGIATKRSWDSWIETGAY